MSKLIQKAGFLNPKRAGRYMNYIATRDGVELLMKTRTASICAILLHVREQKGTENTVCLEPRTRSIWRKQWTS